MIYDRILKIFKNITIKIKPFVTDQDLTMERGHELPFF